jgi:succinate-semialdehyde dehydrogenase/glutarate-semialdehyde dehydrogenase
MPIQSVNPANGLLLRSFTPLTDDALLQKIGLAEIAFGLYAEVPLAHRALCMRKLAYLLEYETDDLAALITAEMGKPIVEARAEVAKCASVCRY